MEPGLQRFMGQTASCRSLCPVRFPHVTSLADLAHSRHSPTSAHLLVSRTSPTLVRGPWTLRRCHSQPVRPPGLIVRMASRLPAQQQPWLQPPCESSRYPRHPTSPEPPLWLLRRWAHIRDAAPVSRTAALAARLRAYAARPSRSRAVVGPGGGGLCRAPPTAHAWAVSYFCCGWFPSWCERLAVCFFGR